MERRRVAAENKVAHVGVSACRARPLVVAAVVKGVALAAKALRRVIRPYKRVATLDTEVVILSVLPSRNPVAAVRGNSQWVGQDAPGERCRGARACCIF